MMFYVWGDFLIGSENPQGQILLCSMLQDKARKKDKIKNFQPCYFYNNISLCVKKFPTCRISTAFFFLALERRMCRQKHKKNLS